MNLDVGRQKEAQIALAIWGFDLTSGRSSNTRSWPYANVVERGSSTLMLVCNLKKMSISACNVKYKCHFILAFAAMGRKPWFQCLLLFVRECHTGAVWLVYCAKQDHEDKVAVV